MCRPSPLSLCYLTIRKVAILVLKLTTDVTWAHNYGWNIEIQWANERNYIHQVYVRKREKAAIYYCFRKQQKMA
ncbi:hypothetical protein HanXRQr2_Chr03g0132581 [Helianthus annuus]|uniref:Secreted protein n=1 Tax=Helianthus annuus TaxID=4232 RepID=A0A9K3NYN2_HELAN|nr:hypothetical protein HanXRQr2_Chr03g0132581 [Helianthus annuus]KAJ0945545.1 hypothetical protein HanPSC8_Chr03g0129351 [Helianthus annuus]